MDIHCEDKGIIVTSKNGLFIGGEVVRIPEVSKYLPCGSDSEAM